MNKIDYIFSKIVKPEVLETHENLFKKFHISDKEWCKTSGNIKERLKKKSKTCFQKPLNFKSYLDNNKYVKYMKNFYLSLGTSESLKQMPEFLRTTFGFRPPDFKVANLLQEFQNNLFSKKDTKLVIKKMTKKKVNSNNSLNFKTESRNSPKILNKPKKIMIYEKCDDQFKSSNILLFKKEKIFEKLDKNIRSTHINFYSDVKFKELICKEIKMESDKKVGFIYGDNKGQFLGKTVKPNITLFEKKFETKITTHK